MENLANENVATVETPAIVSPKPSRKEKKSQQRTENRAPTEALVHLEDVYGADGRTASLYDAYIRAHKEDSGLTIEAFFAGIVGKVKAVETALDALAVHRGFIPEASFGYGGESALTIVANIRGEALTASKIRKNAKDRASGRARAAKASAK